MDVSLPQSPSQLADTLANIRLSDVEDEENGSGNVSAQGLSGQPFTDDPLQHSTPTVSNQAISEELKHIAIGLDAIRAQFFTIQEKRHAGVFTLVETPVASGSRESGSTPSKNGKLGTEKSVALDLEMARLNALMEDVSERMSKSEELLRTFDERTSDTQKPALDRRASISSLSSLESFDDALGGIGSIGLLRKPDALKRQHADLSDAWTALQQEAKQLEADLSGDKYMLVFNSFANQMEEMMASLDNALANCHDFVFAFNRDSSHIFLHQSHASQTSAQISASGDVSNHSSSWRNLEERLAVLQTVKRSFNVKRSSYGPACEQMFVALEKGIKQHAPSNGTILRRFAELKTRWRSLRERVSRMDKELRRIEAQLIDLDVDDAQQAATLTPDRLRRGLQHAENVAGTPSSRAHFGTTYSSSLSPSLFPQPSTRTSPLSSSSPLQQAGTGSGQPLTGTPPSKPGKSINRMSMLDLRKQSSLPSGHSVEHARSSSLAIPSAVGSTLGDTIRTRTSSLVNARAAATTPTSSPPTSYPRRAMERKEYAQYSPARGDRRSSSSATSSPQRTLEYVQTPSKVASDTAHDDSMSSDLLADSSLVLEDEETLMEAAPSAEQEPRSSPIEARRSWSAMGWRRETAVAPRDADTGAGRSNSSMGLHRRPSSAASQHGGGIQSKIPRLITSSIRRAPSGHANGEERPSSALSFTSNSTTTGPRTNLFGRSPSSSRIRHTSGLPVGVSESEEQQRERDAALRASMQTPEPTIMARVQRMSLFGGGLHSNRRSSRPPPSSRNAQSIYSTGQSAIASSAGSTTNDAQAPQSKSFNISKRNSSIWSAEARRGRTTPLSAAALAKVPMGTIDLGGSAGHDSASRGSGIAPKTRHAMSSVADGYNASDRMSNAGTFYAPSATSGRATPTFSDGGNSSVWGTGTSLLRTPRTYHAGHGGNAAAAAAASASSYGRTLYRPNPNDAIDVEVARVVNALGIRIERVDPPLARGVQELNPSSSTLVRYQIGDKVIVCKLLQLHRPGSHGEGNANKAKKILTRVGGGWIDLEQYLLSRLGAM